MPKIYCGACKAAFDTIEEHTEHLKNCGAARAILLSVTSLMFGAKDPSHRASHLVNSIPECTSYIEDYARAISEEMTSWDRSVIHKRLCEKLHIDYVDFRPFEADDIDKVPTFEEAKSIIYSALRSKILDHML